MTIGDIIFTLILVLITSGLAYLVLFFPSKLLKTEKLRTIRLTTSLVVGISITSFYLFVPTWKNYKTATIERVSDQFVVTVTGKRALMVHDPISLLMRGTYIDTFKISIPRDKGLINGQEIERKSGYKLVGSLTIDKKDLIIDLYYDNYDKGIRDPLSWNGTYELTAN